MSNPHLAVLPIFDFIHQDQPIWICRLQPLQVDGIFLFCFPRYRSWNVICSLCKIFTGDVRRTPITETGTGGKSWGKCKIHYILQVQKLCSKSHSNPGNKLHWPRACWRLAQSELLVPGKPVQSIQLHQAWALCAKKPCSSAPNSSFPTLPNTRTVQGAIPTKWLQTAANTQHLPHWQPFPKTVIGDLSPFKTESHRQFRNCFITI